LKLPELENEYDFVTPESLLFATALCPNPDSGKAGRVMEAFLKMKKINIAELDAAYEGKV